MNKILNIIKIYFVISFGCFLAALGWTAFLIPAEIVGGGVSGVATLIYFSAGVPVGIGYMIINVGLIALAMRIIGTSFGVKTIFGVIILSLLLGILQAVIKGPIVKDAFMASIIGGALSGVGVGLVFTQGGSTGGTDIVAMLVTKYRNISIGKIILFLDIFIISSSYLVFGSLEKIVYGFVTMAVSSYAIDLVIEGSKQSMQLFIISNNNSLLAERIGNEIRRGVTFIQGRGWYTNEDKEIVMVLARKFELNTILRIIDEVDDNAFVSISSVMGVYGKGFDRIRY